MLQTIRRLLPRGGSLPEEVWRSRHIGIVVLLWAHAGAVPIYSLVRDESIVHAIREGLILPPLAVLAMVPSLNRRARTAIASLGLLTASAIFIHLSSGLIEMHFHFFVMVAVVTLYQDWIPFLTSIAYVLVHHGLMGWIDPSSVYNHAAARNHPWKWAAIHALFISGISVACLVTWRLNELIVDERRRAERRLGLLAEASKVLTSSLELDEILRGMVTLVAPAIADYCVIDLAEEDGSVRRVASAGSPDLAYWAAEIERHPPDLQDQAHPVIRAMASGESQLLASGLVVPFIGRASIVGAMSLATADTAGRRLDRGDLPVAEELARRAAVAIDNARLYARQRTVAETLQHSLLPERLPAIPGIASAARYIAGGPNVEVGGDWYDLIELPGGRLAVAMGDVVGRGERAASLMGQLRNAARAYALEGKQPAELMERLNFLLLDAGSEQMATMLYMVLDAETGMVRYVSAGHPPALLSEPDGSTQFLRCASGLPIGALPTARYEEERALLTPGATLVLYTDGLIEDRSRTLDDGLARLEQIIAEGPEDLDALCEHALARALEGSDNQDDAAILTVRLLPLREHLELTLPTHPGVLAQLRVTLRRWLAQAGASEQESYELLVAAGEACTNAIRHSGGPGTHTFALNADYNGEVVICVRDQGRWREPRARGGGRGLQIIEAYVDEVEVLQRPTGTEVRMRRRLDSMREGMLT